MDIDLIARLEKTAADLGVPPEVSSEIDEAVAALKAQQARIGGLEEQIRSLQNMERTALAWFQCQLDYAAHDGERMPYSASYFKLIEDKIFNEHALRECLKARQALKEKTDE